MKSSKRILCALMATALALSFSACEIKRGEVASHGDEQKKEDKLVVYEMQPCHSESNVVTMTVNGTSVPVTKFTDYDYTQFDFSGKAEIKLTYKSDITSYSVSPLAKGIEATADGKTLTFTITESQYLIVKVNSIRELAIAADDIETDVPEASGEGIYNIVTKYHADKTGNASAVDALNTAITDANAAGGGIVYVPAGLYKINGNIVLKSHVHLYLAGGAVLRSVDTQENYIKTANKSSVNRDVTWMFYNELGATDIKIYGRGVIDANSDKLYNDPTYKLAMTVLFLRQAANILVDGITIVNGSLWTIETKLCYDSTFTNLKVFNAFTGYTENDAIDICESKKALVKHMFAISEDDTYSTKCYSSTGRISSLNETDVYQSLPGNLDLSIDDVTFDDCFGWTHCGTFKVGDGSNYPQSNVTFKNSYSYKCMQAIKVSRYYGSAEYTNIVYDNIDIESYGGRSATDRRWLFINTQTNDSTTASNPGNVEGLTIRNINIRDLGSKASTITGGTHSFVKGLVFENIKIPGQEEYAASLPEMNITDTNAQGIGDIIILPVDYSDTTNPVNALIVEVRTASKKFTAETLADYSDASATAYKTALAEAEAAIDTKDVTRCETALTALAAAKALLQTKTDAAAEANPPAADAKTDLAKNKTVYCSGTQNSDSRPGSAVDGNDSTCWRSQTNASGGAPYYFTVDLGRRTAFDTVYFKWEYCFAQNYRVEVSDDFVNWTALSCDGKTTFSGSQDGKQTLTFDNVATARFVRMYATEKSAGWMGGDYGLGIYTFSVFNKGEAGTGEYENPVPQPTKRVSGNIALHKTATASSNATNRTANLAVDGGDDLDSRWARLSAPNADVQNITVDLGEVYAMNKAVVKWENLPNKYSIEYSTDGATYKKAIAEKAPSSTDFTTSDGNVRYKTEDTFSEIEARFIRLVMTPDIGTGVGEGKYWLSVFEFELYLTSAE